MDTCPSCGKELPIIGGGAFCTYCGAMARTESTDRSHDDTATLPALSGSATGIAGVPVTDPLWSAPPAAPREPNPPAMTQIMPAVAPATHVSGPPPLEYGQSVDYPAATGGRYSGPYQDGPDDAAHDLIPPPPRAGRGVMIAVGVAVVAVAVVAVSLITLGGDTKPSAAQTPPGQTEVVKPTSPDTSATPANAEPAAPVSTSAAPTPSATPTAPRPGPVTGVGSGRCLNIPGGNPADGTQLELLSCNNTAAQSWTYTNGTLQAAGKCLDVRGADRSDRTPVQIFACNGTAAQRWKYDPQTGELQTLGKCLDASGAGTADHTPLILYTCHQSDNQKWHMAS